MPRPHDYKETFQTAFMFGLPAVGAIAGAGGLGYLGAMATSSTVGAFALGAAGAIGGAVGGIGVGLGVYVAGHSLYKNKEYIALGMAFIALAPFALAKKGLVKLKNKLSRKPTQNQTDNTQAPPPVAGTGQNSTQNPRQNFNNTTGKKKDAALNNATPTIKMAAKHHQPKQ